MMVASHAGMLSSGVLLPKACSSAENQQVKQAELRHRLCDRSEENADRGGKKQINRGTHEEQRDRPCDRNAEQSAHDKAVKGQQRR